VTGLRLRGDWLGFDGLGCGVHACDAIALGTGEIRSFPYDGVMATFSTPSRWWPNSS
jgi:CRP/FNR family transcriptional regulator